MYGNEQASPLEMVLNLAGGLISRSSAVFQQTVLLLIFHAINE